MPSSDVNSKAPRELLAAMANGNPRLVKMLENMQAAAFDDLPNEIIITLQTAAMLAEQASMMANQIRSEISPYLSAVGLSFEAATYLSPVAHYEFTTINNITNVYQNGTPTT